MKKNCEKFLVYYYCVVDLLLLALVFRNSFPYTPCRNQNNDLVTGMNKITICIWKKFCCLENCMYHQSQDLFPQNPIKFQALNWKKQHLLSSMFLVCLFISSVCVIGLGFFICFWLGFGFVS